MWLGAVGRELGYLEGWDVSKSALIRVRKGVLWWHNWCRQCGYIDDDVFHADWRTAFDDACRHVEEVHGEAGDV